MIDIKVCSFSLAISWLLFSSLGLTSVFIRKGIWFDKGPQHYSIWVIIGPTVWVRWQMCGYVLERTKLAEELRSVARVSLVSSSKQATASVTHFPCLTFPLPQLLPLSHTGSATHLILPLLHTSCDTHFLCHMLGLEFVISSWAKSKEPNSFRLKLLKPGAAL